jgi:hypothetical protein
MCIIQASISFALLSLSIMYEMRYHKELKGKEIIFKLLTYSQIHL